MGLNAVRSTNPRASMGKRSADYRVVYKLKPDDGGKQALYCRNVALPAAFSTSHQRATSIRTDRA